MTIAILGASGFLGKNLINYLLQTTDWKIKAISRHVGSIDVPDKYKQRVELLTGDVFDDYQLTEYFEGVDVAYYFVHLMGQENKDFYGQEDIAAHRFSAAVIAANVKRVIYMGGLGNDHEQLSEHLLSRHNTGTLLREHCPQVLEFRASMIIGRGSIAFDIISNLVQKLPVMTMPRWSISKTQPIALSDALLYLKAGATVDMTHHQIVEIGGPTVLAYKDFYKKYATFVGKNPFIVRLPFLPEWLGGKWLDLFTPHNHAKIGRIMVHSMSNTMIVTHTHAKELFPQIQPRSIDRAFRELPLS